jgi:hypothetical protein
VQPPLPLAQDLFSVQDAVDVLASLVDPSDDDAVQTLDCDVLLEHLVSTANVTDFSNDRDPHTIKRGLVRSWKKTKKLSAPCVGQARAMRRHAKVKAAHLLEMQGCFKWPWETRMVMSEWDVRAVLVVSYILFPLSSILQKLLPLVNASMCSFHHFIFVTG